MRLLLCDESIREKSRFPINDVTGRKFQKVLAENYRNQIESLKLFAFRNYIFSEQERPLMHTRFAKVSSGLIGRGPRRYENVDFVMISTVTRKIFRRSCFTTFSRPFTPAVVKSHYAPQQRTSVADRFTRLKKGRKSSLQRDKSWSSIFSQVLSFFSQFRGQQFEIQSSVLTLPFILFITIRIFRPLFCNFEMIDL